MKSSNIITIILIILSIILIFVRTYLILELPVFAYIDYISDDELMVEQAVNIKEGKWLGTYGYNTLLKSPVFPMFLALISVLKIPYIFSVTICYILACILFVFSIKNIIKNKFALFITFVFMIFNPIMYSTDFQRVYRNSLAPSLALMTISFSNIVLLNRKNGSNPRNSIYIYILGVLGTTLILPFFYYIREDSIWIMPFICFYIAVIILSIVIDTIKIKKIKLINVFKILILFLPFISIIIFETVIGNINYKYYGEKIINMNNFTSLQEAIHAINIVKNDPPTEATNPREKMRKLYNYSPTLGSMKDVCEMLQDNISGKDGSVGDGMFGWVILETVSQSGYTTLEEQSKVFKAIADEINTAILEGKLETQELTPIFNDAAGYKFDLRKIFIESLNALKLINDYETFGIMDTYGSLYSSELFETRIRYFLEITNDKLLLNNEPNSWKSFGELIKDNQKDYIDRMQPKIDTLRKIREIYNDISYIINPLGYISYLVLTVILIIKLIKKEQEHILDNWIVSSGLLGATLTLCAGIGYTSAIKVPLTIAFYLMSGYILNTAFCLISIISVFSIITYVIRERKNKIKVEK